jgi:hypothetical protein
MSYEQFGDDAAVGEAFRQHTADPEAFDAYIEKMRVLGIEDHNISDAQMRSIQAKTMVIVGDADGVKPEHAVAMFKLRGGGDEEAAATGAISTAPPGQTRHPPCDFSHLDLCRHAGPRADDHRILGRRASSQSITLVTCTRGQVHLVRRRPRLEPSPNVHSGAEVSRPYTSWHQPTRRSRNLRASSGFTDRLAARLS